MFYDLATRYPTRPEGVEAERRLVAARPRWRRIDGLN
jgi:hypothetical protein